MCENMINRDTPTTPTLGLFLEAKGVVDLRGSSTGGRHDGMIDEYARNGN